LGRGRSPEASDLDLGSGQVSGLQFSISTLAETPVQDEAGRLVPRERGTPQGGVGTPLTQKVISSSREQLRDSAISRGAVSDVCPYRDLDRSTSAIAPSQRDLPEWLSFFAFPRHLWRKLRTTKVIDAASSK